MRSGSLNTLEGICYALKFDGTIAAVGADNWDRTAGTFESAVSKAGTIVGRNIFEFICGEDVIATYQRLMRNIHRRQSRAISFFYRCDGPSVRRKLKMSLSLLEGQAFGDGVLCQSTLLSETSRPAIRLFDAAYMKSRRARPVTMPIITICSYCHDVKQRGTGALWQSPERYLEKGGTEDVRIGHGVCPKCFDYMSRL